MRILFSQKGGITKLQSIKIFFFTLSHITSVLCIYYSLPVQPLISPCLPTLCCPAFGPLGSLSPPETQNEEAFGPRPYSEGFSSPKPVPWLFQLSNFSLNCPYRIELGTSGVVQWLRICLPMQDTWVPSLVRELRSHVPWGN